MSLLMLVILIALAWLSYPVAGAANVGALVLEGKRPKGAGFSFVAELVIFPALFLGVAALIDYFAMPWGRMLVGAFCIAQFASQMYVLLRAIQRQRSAHNRRD